MSPGICTIYYPGLLGPSTPLGELDISEWPDKDELPVLNHFLASGKVSAVESDSRKQAIEGRILRLLGVAMQQDQIPVAGIRHDYYRCADGHNWCIDPVHLQVDLEEAILMASDELSLDEQDARQLIDDINQHFAQDDLHIEYCAPHKWLLKGRLDLATTPLSEVRYKNINDYMPRGKDEARWRQVLNEIQMLLHGHPVNEKRQLQGKLAINSLWLWGSGSHHSITTPFELLYSDDELAIQAASLAGVTQKSLLDEPDLTMLANSIALIVMIAQMNMINRNDVFGWFAALKHFDSNILLPLADMLKKRRLKKVVLVSDAFEVVLDQSEMHRGIFSWFKPTKSFQKHIMQLRGQYAE